MCAAAQPRLVDARPDLVAQLAPGLNDEALVAKVTPGSNRKLTWICPPRPRERLHAATSTCGPLRSGVERGARGAARSVLGSVPADRTAVPWQLCIQTW